MQGEGNWRRGEDHPGSIKGYWAQHTRPGTLQKRRSGDHLPERFGSRANAEAIAQIGSRARKVVSAFNKGPCLGSPSRQSEAESYSCQNRSYRQNFKVPIQSQTRREAREPSLLEIVEPEPACRKILQSLWPGLNFINRCDQEICMGFSRKAQAAWHSHGLCYASPDKHSRRMDYPGIEGCKLRLLSGGQFAEIANAHFLVIADRASF